MRDANSSFPTVGPAGSAVMLEVMTDNRNRTAADIRHLFSKYGGNLGETGCVGWMFHKKAIFVVDKEAFDDEESLMMIALDAGAEDFKAEDDSFEITAAPEDFDAISQALEENNIETVGSPRNSLPPWTSSWMPAKQMLFPLLPMPDTWDSV